MKRKTSLFWSEQEPSIDSMYLRNASILHVKESKEIQSFLPCLTNKKVLDLGSGIGRFTRHFARQCAHLITVDMTKSFVEKNRYDHKDLKNVKYVQSDAMHFHPEDNSFDFIFVNWLFMYLEDVETHLLIHRLHSWLKTQGQLYMRETCKIPPENRQTTDYPVHYRTPMYYESLTLGKFTLLKEGSIQTFIDLFADPLQCYWLFEKNSNIHNS
jgi:phosphoethanolamine N-methyltransferase